MSSWIFVVTSHKVDDGVLSADDIFQQRMKDKFWGLGEKTPNRGSLQKGNQVVFYLGLPRKVFAGTAVLSSACFELSPGQRDHFSHGKSFFRTALGVLLDDIRIWSQARPIEDLVSVLSFIENKQSWFAYLQGGVRPIPEQDFRTITEGRDAAAAQKQVPLIALESESEFAMESHLEEFIARNWDSIDFGSKLILYKSEDQDGRQFPAGPWSIDFLCVDKDSGDFVVVELKRGKSSDSTVGQILRYISWVQENLAKPGQKTRGIIIAKEVDDAMQYAVRVLPNVTTHTYRVDFKLLPANK